MPDIGDAVDAVSRAAQGVVWRVKSAGRRTCQGFNAAAEASMGAADASATLISWMAEKVGLKVSPGNVSYGITFMAPFVTGAAGLLVGRAIYRRR